MEKEWYVVNTYSGHENKVKEKLEMRASTMGMEDYIFRVVVPEQKEIEYKNGEQKEKVTKMFPGYILVEMIMTDEAWFIVRNTPGVTGFIGSSGKGAKPIPLLPEEVDRILSNMGMSRLDLATDLAEGKQVKITDGPFKGMTGKICKYDAEKQQVELSVDLFGQVTSIEVELSQIENLK